MKDPLLKYSIDSLVWIANENRKKRKVSPLTVQDILTEVCTIFDQSEEMVKGKSRKRQYTNCRNITSYVSCLITKHTLQSIADVLGHRDHTTIISCRDRVRDWMKVKDPIFVDSWNVYTENSTIWAEYIKSK